MTTVRRRAMARAATCDAGPRKRLKTTARSSPPRSISTATKCSERVTMWRSLKSQIGAGSGMGSTAGNDCIGLQEFPFTLRRIGNEGALAWQQRVEGTCAACWLELGDWSDGGSMWTVSLQISLTQGNDFGEPGSVMANTNGGDFSG